MSKSKKNGSEVWMSAPAVAEFLDLHVNTVKRIPPQELPYWRAGVGHGNRKYARADVLAYIERRMVR
jgi:hypothetical protein